MLTTLPLQIQNSFRSHSWSYPSCCVFTRNTVTFSSDLYTSTVQSGSPSGNAGFPPHPRLQISYPLSAHFLCFPSALSPLPLAPGCPSTPSASSPPLTLSRFFNGMLEIFKPGALNYFTFFRLIPLTLSVSRNPVLTHLPFFGFLNCLLYVLIAPTLGLAFSLVMPRTLAEASSFSSGRAYLSLNFLPLLFLRLISAFNYVGVNISLSNSCSLSFLNVYAPPICSLTDGRTNSFSPSILPSSRNLIILGDYNCHHPLRDSRGTSDPVGRRYSTGSSFLTSSPSMTLTHLLFSIAPLAFAFPLIFPLLPPL